MSWLPSSTPAGYDIERANRNALIIRGHLTTNISGGIAGDVEIPLPHFTFLQKRSYSHEMKARTPMVEEIRGGGYKGFVDIPVEKAIKHAHFHNVNYASFLESIAQISPLLHETFKTVFKDAHVTAVSHDDESSIATESLQRFCDTYGASMSLYGGERHRSRVVEKVKYQKSYHVEQPTNLPTKQNKLWARISEKTSSWRGSTDRFAQNVLDLIGDQTVIKNLSDEGLECDSFRSAVRVSLRNGETRTPAKVELTTTKTPIHDLYVEFSGRGIPSVDVQFNGQKPYVYNHAMKRSVMLVNRDWTPESPEGGFSPQSRAPSLDFSDANFTDILFHGIPVSITTKSTWRSVVNLDWKVLETHGREPIVFRMPALESLTITAVGGPGCDWPVFKAPSLANLRVVSAKDCGDVVSKVNGLFHEDEEPDHLLKLTISAYKNASGAVISTPFKEFIHKSVKMLIIENISAHQLFSNPGCPPFEVLEVLEYEPLCSFSIHQDIKYPLHQDFSTPVFPKLKRIHLCKTFQEEDGFSMYSLISLTVSETCHSIQADSTIRPPVEINGQRLEITLEALQLPCVRHNRLLNTGKFIMDLDSTGQYREAPKL